MAFHSYIATIRKSRISPGPYIACTSLRPFEKAQNSNGIATHPEKTNLKDEMHQKFREGWAVILSLYVVSMTIALNAGVLFPLYPVSSTLSIEMANTER